jgi:hypothetical protein
MGPIAKASLCLRTPVTIPVGLLVSRDIDYIFQLGPSEKVPRDDGDGIQSPKRHVFK